MGEELQSKKVLEAFKSDIDLTRQGDDYRKQIQLELDNALVESIIADRLYVAKVLIKQGANINSTNSRGQTLLTVSALLGLDTMVWRLWILKCDINKSDGNGNTALMLAALSNHQGIIRLLMNAGADIHIKNTDGSNVWDIIIGTSDKSARARMSAIITGEEGRGRI